MPFIPIAVAGGSIKQTPSLQHEFDGPDISLVASISARITALLAADSMSSPGMVCDSSVHDIKGPLLSFLICRGLCPTRNEFTSNTEIRRRKTYATIEERVMAQLIKFGEKSL